MKLVFVRHGQRDKSQGVNGHLTPKGREQARRAGEYLHRAGIRPDWLCHTKWHRTRETAEIVLGVLGVQCPANEPDGGWAARDLTKIHEKVDKWVKAAPHEVKVLLFVGHEKQQDPLVELFGFPEIPEDNRACVLVIDCDDDGHWSRGEYFPGS